MRASWLTKNLIERLWRFVRMESLNSTYHEKFEDFQSAIDGCLYGLGTVHMGENGKADDAQVSDV